MKKEISALVIFLIIVLISCDLKHISQSDFYDNQETKKEEPVSYIEDTAAIYVCLNNGDDLNSGLTYQEPVASIMRGITLASETEGRSKVFVAAGVYGEVVTMAEGISLYGGYNVTFTRRNNKERNNPEFRTVITREADDDRGMIICGGLTALTVIDGFTISADRGGNFSTAITIGYTVDEASPTIKNNTITGGSAPDSCGIFVAKGNPLIRNNHIYGGDGSDTAYGIRAVLDTMPEIAYNSIDGQGNSEDLEANSYGIKLESSLAKVRNNYLIAGGRALYKSVGISCSGTGMPEIGYNNFISGGTGARTRALYCSGQVKPKIEYNTLHSGSSTTSNICIEITDAANPAINNNWINFFYPGGYGIYEKSGTACPDSLNGNSFLDEQTGIAPFFYVENTGDGESTVLRSIGEVNNMGFLNGFTDMNNTPNKIHSD